MTAEIKHVTLKWHLYSIVEREKYRLQGRKKGSWMSEVLQLAGCNIIESLLWGRISLKNSFFLFKSFMQFVFIDISSRLLFIYLKITQIVIYLFEIKYVSKYCMGYKWKEERKEKRNENKISGMDYKPYWNWLCSSGARLLILHVFSKASITIIPGQSFPYIFMYQEKTIVPFLSSAH